MDDIVIKKDNSKEAAKEIRAAIERGLETIGQVCRGYAITAAPFDTGWLREHIEYDVRDNTVYVGTNVPYAPYVELGTSKQRKQPFLTPAAQDHASQYRTILKNELEG